MIKLIKHGINLIKHQLKDVGISKKRSSHWPKLEKEFLEQHPTCEICGSKTRLNVHHIKPFHLFPELELDPTNLITLCMSRKECHFKIAHGSNFSSYCPNINLYIKQFHNKEKTFEELCLIAKSEKLFR